jgi:hypothetical protein
MKHKYLLPLGSHAGIEEFLLKSEACFEFKHVFFYGVPPTHSE